MKSELAATVELTAEDVKQAIATYVESKFNYGDKGVEPKDVQLHISSRTMGHGLGEYQETYFEKATVRVVLENSK